MDKYEDAMRCYDRAIEINPTNSEYFNGKGK
jgi:tetratricopeptide (TPR) repeat protein